MSIGSNLSKFLLGVSLAIAILLAGGIAAALFLVNSNFKAPPKPFFANDQPSPAASPRLKVAAKAKNAPITALKPSPTPTPTQQLEPGAYRARVTWSDGLSLRSEPNSDAEHIGSLSYNQQVVVLSESQDQNWQRVRVEDSGQVGWVKAGNTARTEPHQ